MKQLLGFFLFCMLGTAAIAQNCSGGCQFSLLTASPADDLYAGFGHSAIRVLDTVNNKDVVYNYGTFNFNTPNFYPKFVRGQLLYRLSKGSLKRLKRGYIEEGRSLKEEVLLLTPEEQHAFHEFLINNYRKENREYLYDFFFDNCSTRIRDILEEVQGDKLQFPEKPDPELTFRQLLNIYVGHRYWLDFGMDLIVGMPADQVADVREQMFLPDYLSYHFADAKVMRDGKSVPLIAPAKELVPLNQPEKAPMPLYVRPVFIFWALFGLMLLMTWLGNDRLKKSFDLVFFTLIGLAGLLVFFMWFGTEHPTTKMNLNLLWTNPLYLLLPFFGFWKDKRVGQIIGIIILLGLLVVIFAKPWLPQAFPYGFYPIVLILALRLSDQLFKTGVLVDLIQ